MGFDPAADAVVWKPGMPDPDERFREVVKAGAEHERASRIKRDLSAREFGSWFAPFERELVFVRRLDHVGWFRPTGASTGILLESPFWHRARSFVYRFPRIEAMPREGDAVELDVVRVHRSVRAVARDGSATVQDVADVEGARPLKLDLPTPEGDLKDFLFDVAGGWRSAEADRLDTVIALGLVGAPRAQLGAGGVTCAAYRAGRRQAETSLAPLRKTYQRIVAPEFQKPDRAFLGRSLFGFAWLGARDRASRVERLRRDFPLAVTSEARVSRVGVESPLPFDVPQVILEATPRPDAELELWRIYQYQLTALMRAPEIPAALLSTTMRRVDSILKMEDVDRFVRLSPAAVAEVALSLARLRQVGDRVRAEDVHEAGRLVAKQVGAWYDHMRERFGVKSEAALRASRRAPLLGGDLRERSSHRLPVDHRAVLMAMRRLREEQGSIWVGGPEVIGAARTLALDERTVERLRVMGLVRAFDVLADLVREGYVVRHARAVLYALTDLALDEEVG